MPEYKAPGVYVEETSFRAKAIEGVPTSTAGFAGITRFGPVAYAGGPSNAQPRLITSYAEFERVYGGVSPLELASGARIAYLAHAVRAFFDNGGSRLYVSRVYVPAAGKTVKECASSLTVATTAGSAAWRARWPGADGNVLVEVQAARGKNIAFEYPNDGLGKNAWGIQAKNVLAGAVLEVTASGGTLPIGNAPLSASTLRVVEMDPSGKQTFIGMQWSEIIHMQYRKHRTPLVPRKLTRGITERIDMFGTPVIPMYEFEVEKAARELIIVLLKVWLLTVTLLLLANSWTIAARR